MNTGLIDLIKSKPNIIGIVYISCELITLERDLQRLCDPYYTKYIPFTAVKCYGADFFPQTFHQG